MKAESASILFDSAFVDYDLDTFLIKTNLAMFVELRGRIELKPNSAMDENELPKKTDTGSYQQSEIQDFLLLQRAALRISSILDLDTLLEQIVDDVMQTFGYSRSAILFVDEATNEVEIVAVRGWTTNYHMKGDRFKIGQGMTGHVAETGKMHYAPDVLKDPYYMVSEESSRSEVDFPLKSGGKTIGVFNAQHPDVDAFPPHRLKLLEALADHISVAVENARAFERERLAKGRMEKEMEEARAVQARLFPKKAPEIPHFRLSGLSKPCQAIGGDWYDYIKLPSGKIGIVLGDVAGKGPGAALLMSSSRSILRMYAIRVETPGAVLTEVSRVLMSDIPVEKFVTMIYAVLDPMNRTLTFANAGHHPPVLVNADGPHFFKTPPEFPLGIMKKEYPEHTIKFTPGDRLFLYSDGVVEARNPKSEDYGEDRLLHHLESPTATVESLLKEVQNHAEGHPAMDDITVVKIEALE